MDFTYPPETDAFRSEVSQWLHAHLSDEFAALGGEINAETWPTRRAWERAMGDGGWIGLSWPKRFGGRQATVLEELIFAEEYARGGGPTRAGTFGEGILGPTLIQFGSLAQQERFLPPILRGEEIWCQGFSEPGAGSDLASLRTTAAIDRGNWVLEGQKVWTSQAQLSDWIFVLARTDQDAPRHRGISFFLLPLKQPGIEIRPLRDLAGAEHFCEVFFDGARTDADLIVGEPGEGWKIAMATLGFERGTSFMGQLVRYGGELQQLINVSRGIGRLDDPTVRQDLAGLKIGYELMRYGLYRTVTAVLRDGRPGLEASIGKLQWSQWHQQLGEVAATIIGPAMIAGETRPEIEELRRNFLFSRAHTIYAGTSQVQRNIIAERVLGLPKEP
jgi:hypothetical protein